MELKRKHAADMVRLHESTLETLVLAIDAKDRNRVHAIRVQRYARELATEMNLGEEEVEGIAAAALLHDIGTLAVPEYILRKRGALTVEEMAKMRLHPETGAEIISNINFSYPVSEAIKHHHEHVGGSGYPSGLKGEEIPLAARLLAVVEACDSFMSRHRDRADKAMEMLERSSGTQFDPSIMAACKSLYSDVTASAVADEAALDAKTPYREIERVTSEVDSLEALAEKINTLESVEEIALTATRMLEDHIVPSTAIFWAINCDELVAVTEPGEEQRMIPIGAGVSGWVAAEHSPCVNMTANFGQFTGSRFVAVPVLPGSAILGVLSLYTGTPEFSDDEVRLVTATAERIAGSLNNARTLEVARMDAISDRLTRLANRRGLEKAFETMQHQPYSVALFYINAFKAVNDTFGHQAGDDALVSIAEHLRSAFGSGDVICRLGGDEFLIATTEPAFGVHRSIREFRNLIAHDPKLEPYKGLGFGVSWGVASSPEDGRNLSAVTAVADERMYEQKSRMKQKDRMPMPVERSLHGGSVAKGI